MNIRIKNTTRRATKIGGGCWDQVSYIDEAGVVYVPSNLAGIDSLAAALTGEPQVRFFGHVYLDACYLSHLATTTVVQRMAIATIVRRTRDAAKVSS